jgi:hypothetical protein
VCVPSWSLGREGYSLNFFGDNCEQLTVVIKEAAEWIAAKQNGLLASNVVAEYANSTNDEF